MKKDLDKPGKLNHLGSLLQTPSKDTIAYDATLNKLSQRKLSLPAVGVGKGWGGSDRSSSINLKNIATSPSLVTIGHQNLFPSPSGQPLANMRTLAGALMTECSRDQLLSPCSLPLPRGPGTVRRGMANTSPILPMSQVQNKNMVKNSDLQSLVNNKITASQALHSDSTASSHRNFYQSTFITGSRIDDVCEKKEKNAAITAMNVRELEQERDQLKALNIKLLTRVEIL